MAQSQIRQPSLEELRAAFTSPKSQFDPSQMTQAYATGTTLADTIASKKLDRQKAEEDLKKEIFALTEAQNKKAEEDKAAQLLQPVTANTPLSTQVPATAGNVANVNPNPTVVPGQEDHNQVIQTPPQVQSQLESERGAALKGLALKLNPTAIAPALFGVQKTPQIAINTETGASRIVQPDINGNLNLQPGEQLKDVAVAQTRAQPFRERNAILLQQVQQNYGFKTANVAGRLGDKLTLGSLKGSDQDAARAYRFSNRGLAAINQALTDPSQDTVRNAAEIALETARVLTGTGVVAQGTFEKLVPRTFKGDLSQYMEYAAGHPEDASLLPFFKAYGDILDRQKTVNGAVVKNAIAKHISGDVESLRRVNPDVLESTLEGARGDLGDITDELIQDIVHGHNIHLKPQAPAAPAAGGKPDIGAALRAILPKRK